MNQQSQSRRPRGIELRPRTPSREASNQTDDWGWGSQSHGYYNRAAYAPDYTEIDSGPYEMEHMSHVISRDSQHEVQVIHNDATYEVIPGESPRTDVPPIQPEACYTGLVGTEPVGRSQTRCLVVWLWVLVILLLSITTVLLLVLFGGECNYSHKDLFSFHSFFFSFYFRF